MLILKRWTVCLNAKISEINGYIWIIFKSSIADLSKIQDIKGCKKSLKSASMKNIYKNELSLFLLIGSCLFYQIKISVTSTCQSGLYSPLIFFTNTIEKVSNQRILNLRNQILTLATSRKLLQKFTNHTLLNFEMYFF